MGKNKKLSMTMREEFADLEEEMDDFLMHTEIVKDEVQGGAARGHMSKAWNNMDKAYEQFKARVKQFIKAQQQFNEGAGPEGGGDRKDFKSFFEKSTKIITDKSEVDEHWHEGTVDDEGDGKTTKTLPKGHPEHRHQIVGGEVKVSKRHEHTIKA
jgi:hypothetical protein